MFLARRQLSVIFPLFRIKYVMKLLILNVTELYRGQRMKYSIVPTPGSQDFDIAPSNGTLFIIRSPDHEKQARYNLKVRADIVKRGRSLPVMLYPLSSGKLADLGKFYFWFIFYMFTHIFFIFA